MSTVNKQSFDWYGELNSSGLAHGFGVAYLDIGVDHYESRRFDGEARNGRLYKGWLTMKNGDCG